MLKYGSLFEVTYTEDVHKKMRKSKNWFDGQMVLSKGEDGRLQFEILSEEGSRQIQRPFTDKELEEFETGLIHS